jgi:hypothetical protein
MINPLSIVNLEPSTLNWPVKVLSASFRNRKGTGKIALEGF